MLVQQIGPLQVGPLKMLVRQIGPPQNVGAANRAPANCAPGKFPNPVLKLCTHTSNRYISPHPGGGDICLWGCAQCAGARFAVPSSSRGPICHSTIKCGTQFAAKSTRGPIYLEPPNTYVYPIVFKIIQIRISTRLILLFSNN